MKIAARLSATHPLIGVIEQSKSQSDQHRRLARMMLLPSAVDSVHRGTCRGHDGAHGVLLEARSRVERSRRPLGPRRHGVSPLSFRDAPVRLGPSSRSRRVVGNRFGRSVKADTSHVADAFVSLATPEPALDARLARWPSERTSSGGRTSKANSRPSSTLTGGRARQPIRAPALLHGASGRARPAGERVLPRRPGQADDARGVGDRARRRRARARSRRCHRAQQRPRLPASRRARGAASAPRRRRLTRRGDDQRSARLRGRRISERRP